MSNIERYFAQVQEKRRHRQRAIVIFGIAALGILGAASIFFILVSSPWFRLQGIRVSGIEHASSSRVTDLVLASWSDRLSWQFFLPISNVAAFPSTVPARLLALAPDIDAIEIHPHFVSRTLEAKVHERVPLGMWCRGGDEHVLAQEPHCRLVDSAGVAYSRVPAASGNLLRVVFDGAPQPLRIGDSVLPPELFSNLKSILAVLDAAPFKISRIVVGEAIVEEVNVSTVEGPTLLFNLRFPADNLLNVILRLSQKPGFSNLHTIDFRVHNKVFYK